ncbi:MAG: aminotransferase class V-fold PLP-dependent enzyme [Alphaproteobacteria bacterium]|nr:aminotransferase class V-fold PLP-dependent enzyme [Alphaproteobacteria bacterium]
MTATDFLPTVQPWLGPECGEAVRAQVDSGFLGPGNAARRFGERLAALAGVPHAVPTISGTIALTVAAKALGLNPGDEVLVPAYGVVSTINAFTSVGLSPRLVDIEFATGCMDAAELRARVTPRTKAVCFVDFSGHTGEPLIEAAALCQELGLPLIEDAACALGQHFEGRKAGSFGTVGCLSFSVAKVMTTGQGGALLTADRGLADRATAWIDHGDLDWRATNTHRHVGTNLRFNDVLAALGLAQLDTLDARLERKRAAFAALQEELDGYLFTVPGGEAPLHNIVFCDQPEAMVRELRARNIGAVQQYRCLANHPVYAHLGNSPYAAARRWERTSVYLPFGLGLTADDARRIGRAVRETGLPLHRPRPSN